jgi:hypothetical protein
MATITSCEQVEHDGSPALRVRFQVHNTNAFEVCQMFFDRVGMENDPSPVCTQVDATGPSGWTTYVLSSGIVWVGCFAGGIESGETLSGFEFIVVEGSCCGRFSVANALDNIASELLCVQCATPSEPNTWGRLKSVYR